MVSHESHDVPTADQLLQRMQAGDEQAASELLVRYRDRLKQMVRARMDPRLRRRVDASDIVQEALVDAAAKLPKYRIAESVPFYPWVRQITWEHLVRAHRHHIQTQKRSVAREEAPQMEMSDHSHVVLADRLVSEAISPSAQLTRDELIRNVRRCLGQLADKDRELILLRYVEQLSTDEIAAVLGTTVAAVKMRHLRCLRRMRELLDSNP